MFNNPLMFAVMIVLIVMVASVVKTAVKTGAADGRRGDDPETLRMKEEMKALRDRVAVLERIATEKESLLEREIEQLRDR